MLRETIDVFLAEPSAVHTFWCTALGRICPEYRSGGKILPIGVIVRCATDLRELDLSDCWWTTTNIQKGVLKCVSEVKLNVVNSPLKALDVVGLLEKLKNVEDLSLTIAQNSEADISVARLKTYPILKERTQK